MSQIYANFGGMSSNNPYSPQYNPYRQVNNPNLGQPAPRLSGGGLGRGLVVREQLSQQGRKCTVPRVLSDNTDSHELLKQEIGRQDEAQYLGFGDPTGLSFASNSAASVSKGQATVVSNNHGFEWVELYFDSVHRNRVTTLANGDIAWSINNLNNSQGIASIIGICIEPFYFPKVIVDASLPDFFYYRRVFVEIAGTGSQQSILGPNGQRFHFECQVSNANGQAVLLTPTRSTFYFTQPLIEMTTFQLRFTVPKTDIFTLTQKPVPIYEGTINVVSAITGGFGYNPIRFTITDPGITTNIIGLIGALTLPGVAAYGIGYQSNDDAINGAINNPNGLFITNVIDASTFEIAGIDASAVNAEYPATIFIAKNRISIATRFLSVVTKITNHVTISDVS